MCLGNELNDATGLLDLLLSLSRDKAGLDNDGDLGKSTLAKNLAVTKSKSVNDGGSARGRLLKVLLSLLLRNKSPQTLDVNDGSPEVVLLLVEVSHTDLTKVTRVVLVEVGSVVVLTTGHTTTTGILAVLANTTVTG